ncbi:MAG: glycoside hydrolase family 2, partial [Bacteroidales bacterium]
SLGTQNISRKTEFKASWDVPYKQGTLMAIRKNNSGHSDTCYLKTSGNPYSIRLIPEKVTMIADRQDICFIIVEIVDKSGQNVPYANNLVTFDIKGEGKLLAVGNGDPTSLESYQQPYRKAYEGKCLLVVKSSDKEGQIKVEAKSRGLKTNEITLINSKSAAHNRRLTD